MALPGYYRQNNFNNNNNSVQYQPNKIPSPKSEYPDCKWCAVCVNTQENNMGSIINDNSLLTHIPKTDSYISLEIEETCIALAKSMQEEEHKIIISLVSHFTFFFLNIHITFTSINSTCSF